jgi:hypothetical protein
LASPVFHDVIGRIGPYPREGTVERKASRDFHEDQLSCAKHADARSGIHCSIQIPAKLELNLKFDKLEL